MSQRPRVIGFTADRLNSILRDTKGQAKRKMGFLKIWTSGLILTNGSCGELGFDWTISFVLIGVASLFGWSTRFLRLCKFKLSGTVKIGVTVFSCLSHCQPHRSAWVYVWPALSLSTSIIFYSISRVFRVTSSITHITHPRLFYGALQLGLWNVCWKQI